MHCLGCTLALFVSELSLVLAQQPCYWPNGSSIVSSQGTWINCYSSQASVCCYHGDICLTNGLCYGSQGGMTYRGACTVKNWSNTTACPIQWCNDVLSNSSSNLWPCATTDYGTPQWWCGKNEVTKACQSGIDAHFNFYTSGSILGAPLVTPSPSPATTDSRDLATTTFFAGLSSEATTFPASSPAKTSTGPPLSAQIQGQSTNLPIDPPAPARTQEHSASLPIAIGVGIGVPLGIVGIGLLVLLFWKEAARQGRSKSQILSQRTVLGKEDRRATAAIGGGRSELPDAQLARELEDTGKRELPVSEDPEK